MPRPIQAIVLLIGISALVPCAAMGQSQGSGGYWDRGRWIGYMPPHLQQAGADQQAATVARAEGPRVADRRVERSSAAVQRGRYTQASYDLESLEQIDPVPLMDDSVMAAPNVGGGYQESYGPGAARGCGPDCGYDCGPDCAPDCGGCTLFRQPTFWTRVEMLGWWTSGMNLPPLVTTSVAGTSQEEAGVLGEEGTSILFGNQAVNEDSRSGIRAVLGMWLEPCQMHGIEFSYIGLGTESTVFRGSDTGQGAYSILGRPFGNLELLRQDANLMAYPGVYSGWVSVDASTEFQGTEVLLRKAVKRCCYSQVDFLIGYRWLQLKDDLLIDQHSVEAQTTTNIDLYDRFNTKNNFHGAEFGLQWTRPLNCLWTFEAVGKFAIGNTRSVVLVDGQTTVVTTGGTTVTDGGLLAQESNMGSRTRDHFATVSEIGLTLKRRFSPRLEMTFGYTFL
ncbi:MAG: BBP7 family outer membrane beta-barrel protein [Pirellulaceae bacterium]|nr:BBP7 family outer membrane beta-barrel protein [Pirellulaceae bacterium]